MPPKSNKISTKWVQWRIQDDERLCQLCESRKNIVIPIAQSSECPLHPNCQCWIDKVGILTAGEVTNEGKDGADYWIRHKGKLPDKYITKEEAKPMGWVRKRQNLAEVAPGKVFGGDIFTNDKNAVPKKPGRIWYEADINSTTEERGLARIVYSNDGLMFATYDHYETLYEIIG